MLSRFSSRRQLDDSEGRHPSMTIIYTHHSCGIAPLSISSTSHPKSLYCALLFFSDLDFCNCSCPMTSTREILYKLFLCICVLCVRCYCYCVITIFVESRFPTQSFLIGRASRTIPSRTRRREKFSPLAQGDRFSNERAPPLSPWNPLHFIKICVEAC